MKKAIIPLLFLLLAGIYAHSHNYMIGLNANGKTIDSLNLADTNRTPWMRYPGPWPATSMLVQVTSTAADTVRVEMLDFQHKAMSLDSSRNQARIYQPSRSSSDDSIAVCILQPGGKYVARFRVYEMYIDQPIALTRGYPYDYKPSRKWEYEIMAYDEGAK